MAAAVAGRLQWRKHTTVTVAAAAAWWRCSDGGSNCGSTVAVAAV
jgi:hypothetical protein